MSNDGICGWCGEPISGPPSPWRPFRRSGEIEMRPYVPGEDLSSVSVSDADKPPKAGDMIARNPANHED